MKKATWRVMAVSLGLCLAASAGASAAELTLSQQGSPMGQFQMGSMEPGFGGQAYLPGSTERVQQVHEMLVQAGKEESVLLQVDGGINDETLPLVLGAGANRIVAGSWIFRKDIYENALRAQKLIQG